MKLNLYHVTKKESIKSILDEGFRYTGENTSQMGEGICFTDWEELYFWADHLNRWEVLEVTIKLDENEIITKKNFNEDKFKEWCFDNDYLEEIEEGLQWTDRANDLVEFSLEIEGFLRSLYAKENGYKAINGYNQLVVFDNDCIVEVKKHSTIDKNFSIEDYQESTLLEEVE